MPAETEKITEIVNIEIEGIITDNWLQLSADEKVERIESQKKELTLDEFLALFKGYEEEQLIDISDNLEESGVSLVEEKEETKEEVAGIEFEDKDNGKRKEVIPQKPDYLHQVDSSDSIGLYFKEIGQVPLLTAQQEVDLCIRIEKGTKAQVSFSEESAQRELTDKRNEELNFLIEDGAAAKEHLLTANTRLVISVAKKYIGRGVPFLDLVQEGNIGLIRAQKRFEYRRGYKFSTYATWWIRQAVTRAIADQGRTIRVPVHMSEKTNRMLGVNHQLTQEFGRNPTVEETAEAFGEPVHKIRQMIKANQRPISLETPINTRENDDTILSEFIEDEDSPSPVEVATKNLLREEIRNALHTIPPREARVLGFRYGIPNGETYTLEEIGRKMGVTRERVRQIEAQALRRLRHPSQNQKLVDYLRE